MWSAPFMSSMWFWIHNMKLVNSTLDLHGQRTDYTGMCNSSLGELTTHTALCASKQLTALVVEVLKSFVVLTIHLAHLLNLSSTYTSLMEKDPRFKAHHTFTQINTLLLHKKTLQQLKSAWRFWLHCRDCYRAQMLLYNYCGAETQVFWSSHCLLCLWLGVCDVMYMCVFIGWAINYSCSWPPTSSLGMHELVDAISVCWSIHEVRVSCCKVSLTYQLY